jgi:hypothetical protein
VAAQLAASQEGLSSVSKYVLELISKILKFLNTFGAHFLEYVPVVFIRRTSFRVTFFAHFPCFEKITVGL